MWIAFGKRYSTFSTVMLVGRIKSVKQQWWQILQLRQKFLFMQSRKRQTHETSLRTSITFQCITEMIQLCNLEVFYHTCNTSERWEKKAIGCHSGFWWEPQGKRLYFTLSILHTISQLFLILWRVAVRVIHRKQQSHEEQEFAPFSRKLEITAFTLQREEGFCWLRCIDELQFHPWQMINYFDMPFFSPIVFQKYFFYDISPLVGLFFFM